MPSGADDGVGESIFCLSKRISLNIIEMGIKSGY